MRKPLRTKKTSTPMKPAGQERDAGVVHREDGEGADTVERTQTTIWGHGLHARHRSAELWLLSSAIRACHALRSRPRP